MGSEYVGRDGRLRTLRDDAWDELRYIYEREGVPTELVDITRPLLESENDSQRTAANKFLNKYRGTYNVNDVPAAKPQAEQLVRAYDKSPGKAVSVSEEEFLAAWDTPGTRERRPAPAVSEPVTRREPRRKSRAGAEQFGPRAIDALEEWGR